MTGIAGCSPSATLGGKNVMRTHFVQDYERHRPLLVREEMLDVER